MSAGRHLKYVYFIYTSRYSSHHPPRVAGLVDVRYLIPWPEPRHVAHDSFQATETKCGSYKVKVQLDPKQGAPSTLF